MFVHDYGFCKGFNSGVHEALGGKAGLGRPSEALKLRPRRLYEAATLKPKPQNPKTLKP